MAILKQGIQGPISGKIGSIVTYELNGQNVVRSAASYTNRKPTALALINRGRMSAVSQFLAPLKRVIAFGYKHVAPSGSRVGTFQAAQSYTFKNAIAYGEENVPYIDPSKVLLFRGALEPPKDLKVECQEQAIMLSWDNTDYQSRDEVLVILGYWAGHKFFVFENGAGKVSEGTYEWHLSSDVLARGETIHIYVAFYDIVRDKLSDSSYARCDVV